MKYFYLWLVDTLNQLSYFSEMVMKLGLHFKMILHVNKTTFFGCCSLCRFQKGACLWFIFIVKVIIVIVILPGSLFHCVIDPGIKAICMLATICKGSLKCLTVSYSSEYKKKELDVSSLFSFISSCISLFSIKCELLEQLVFSESAGLCLRIRQELWSTNKIGRAIFVGLKVF